MYMYGLLNSDVIYSSILFFSFMRLKRVRMEIKFDFMFFVVELSMVWSSDMEQFNQEDRSKALVVHCYASE